MPKVPMETRNERHASSVSRDGFQGRYFTIAPLRTGK